MKTIFKVLAICISLNSFAQLPCAVPKKNTPSAGDKIMICDGSSSKYLRVDSLSNYIGGGGSGSVTSVAVSGSNGIGVSGSPITSSGTISLSLGSITPTTVNGITLSGSSTPSLTVVGSSSIAGSNTGDQTSVTGNSGTATALQTARTIGIATGDVTSSGSTFDGTANNTNAYTLATVNSNVGSFGGATKSLSATVNGKGLVTAISEQTVTPAIGSVTGLGSGVATMLGTFSSANIASACTNETGSAGNLVFSSAPSISNLKLSNLTTNGVLSTYGGDGSLQVGSNQIVLNSNAIALGDTATLTVCGCELTGTTLASSIVSSSLTGVGTVTTGTWNATPINLSSYASGILSPIYGGTGLTSVTTGDLLYGSATNTWAKLAGVATGNVLISGGVATAPSWGKVGLTTHVSGVLPSANGGAGTIRGSLRADGSGTTSANILKDITTSSNVTSTTETLVNSVLVPANTLQAGDALRIVGKAFKTGTVGTVTVRFYANTSNSLSGATLIGTGTGAATTQYMAMVRFPMIKNATTATEVILNTNSIATDEATIATAAVALSTLAINWTSAQYIIMSVQQSSASDTSNGLGLTVQFY